MIEAAQRNDCLSIITRLQVSSALIDCCNIFCIIYGFLGFSFTLNGLNNHLSGPFSPVINPPAIMYFFSPPHPVANNVSGMLCEAFGRHRTTDSSANVIFIAAHQAGTVSLNVIN